MLCANVDRSNVQSLLYRFSVEKLSDQNANRRKRNVRSNHHWTRNNVLFHDFNNENDYNLILIVIDKVGTLKWNFIEYSFPIRTGIIDSIDDYSAISFIRQSAWCDGSYQITTIVLVANIRELPLVPSCHRPISKSFHSQRLSQSSQHYFHIGQPYEWKFD